MELYKGDFEDVPFFFFFFIWSNKKRVYLYKTTYRFWTSVKTHRVPIINKFTVTLQSFDCFWSIINYLIVIFIERRIRELEPQPGRVVDDTLPHPHLEAVFLQRQILVDL